MLGKALGHAGAVNTPEEVAPQRTFPPVRRLAAQRLEEGQRVRMVSAFSSTTSC